MARADDFRAIFNSRPTLAYVLTRGAIAVGCAVGALLSPAWPVFAEDGNGSGRAPALPVWRNPTTPPSYSLPFMVGDPSAWRVTDLPTIQVQQINRTTMRLPGYPPVNPRTQVLAITVQLQNDTPYDLPYSVSFFRVFAGGTPIVGQDLPDDDQHLGGGLLAPGDSVTGVVGFAIPSGVSVQRAAYVFDNFRRWIPLVVTPQ